MRQTPCNHLCKRPLFQFTHPGKGATLVGLCGTIDAYVSIHAPWEGCDNLDTDYYAAIVEVSIHAPWEGCDTALEITEELLTKFQFTHPGKGATGTLQGWRERGSFQFTHPGKGATDKGTADRYTRIGFQFTHPGKGATVGSRKLLSIVIVSIHAPWEGCDYRRSPLALIAGVSIHAPWEGCDF